MTSVSRSHLIHKENPKRKRLFPALLTVACGAMEDLCQKWTQTFTEQTGIQATYVRLTSGEAVARLDSAKNSPEFDV